MPPHTSVYKGRDCPAITSVAVAFSKAGTVLQALKVGESFMSSAAPFWRVDIFFCKADIWFRSQVSWGPSCSVAAGSLWFFR